MISDENHTEYISIPKQEYEQMQQTIFLLQQELANLKRMLFGRKSERYIGEDLSQLSLDLELTNEEEKPVAKENISYTRNKADNNGKKGHSREPIPGFIPRREEIIEPEESLDGAQKIGEAITEVMEYEPGKLYVRRMKRPKYVNKAEERIIIAPLPTLPIPGSNVGPGLLAHIVIQKFIDHIPFYRQSKIFKRDEGVHLAESTMNDWFSATCRLVEPLYRVLKKEVQQSDYLQADETPIPVLTKDKPGSTHKGYQWVYHAYLKKLVCFEYHKSRGREGPALFLKDFRGSLQTDAYQAYNLYENKEGIKLLGCWAHARRYFEKALESDPQRAGYAMDKIKELYMIERKAEEKELDVEEKKQLRQREAIPVLQELKKWMEAQLPEILPKSPIGKALQYTLSIWDRLMAYTDNGKWLIDNNLIENSIRPVTLGRKNYMFAGSHEGAKRAAMMYSFFGSCKLNGVNPWQWFNHVLKVIPDYKVNHLEELLPTNYNKQ